MGCDIHSHAERLENGKWTAIPALKPFDWRAYGMYGFLAGVRNYSDVPPISTPRGVPDDVSQSVREDFEEWNLDAHSASWLSVDELLAFDYDKPIEDRRVTRRLASGVVSGRETAEPGGGTMTTYRDFLGDAFFADLEKLKVAEAARVVFWFDN